MKTHKTLLANKLFALLVAVILLVLIAPAARAQSRDGAALLRHKIDVHGTIVTLGDLFTNAGSKAGIPVFRAPRLGSRGVISVERIAAAARQHNLIWRDEKTRSGFSGRYQIQVYRPARTITLDRIRKIIIQEIVHKNPDITSGNLTANLSGSAKSILLDARLTPEPIVEELEYSRRNGIFRAVLRLAGRNTASLDYVYRGRISETLPIAVPRHNIERGAIIRRSDIMVIRLPKANIRGEVARTIDDMVGFAATRNLRASRTVKLKDLERPRLVRKNTLVTIIYSVPGMRLQAQGKAIEDGGLGELISIMNLQSKRTIHATVTAPGRVTIQPPSKVISGGAAKSKSFTGQRVSLLAGN